MRGWSAIRRSLLALIAALLLLLPQAAYTQSTPAPLPNIGLGFGPGSVIPVSQGIPIYTQGDSVWAESYSNSSTLALVLNSPLGSVTNAVYLPPDGIVEIYTIAASDPSGTWTLSVYNFQEVGVGPVSQISITVAGGATPLHPTWDGASLSRGSVVLRYSMPLTTAYGIQACLGGNFGPTTGIQLGRSMGGVMSVSLNGSTATAFAPGSPSPFEVWFELYAARAYLNGTTLVSEEVLAARSQVVAVGSGSGPTTVGLDPQLNLRYGRYDLRTYVRGASGFLAFDTPYLRANVTSWASLASCSPLADVTSGTFVLNSSLSGSTPSWPRDLLMMYYDKGVDSFGFSSVPTLEARVDLGNSTQALALSKVGATVMGAGVGAWDLYNDSVYLLADSFPLNVTLTLSFGNVTTEALVAQIPAPYLIVPLQVPVGTLNITASVGGAPLANSTVYVGALGSPPVPLETNGTGGASLSLPPGVYNVTLVSGGRSVGTLARVLPGQTAVAALEVSPQAFPLLDAVLAALLVAGIGVDVLIWRAYFARRNAIK